jgi:hypothetical protein
MVGRYIKGSCARVRVFVILSHGWVVHAKVIPNEKLELFHYTATSPQTLCPFFTTKLVINHSNIILFMRVSTLCGHTFIHSYTPYIHPINVLDVETHSSTRPVGVSSLPCFGEDRELAGGGRRLEGALGFWHPFGACEVRVSMQSKEARRGMRHASAGHW